MAEVESLLNQLKALPESKNIWIFGNGHGARLMLDWADQAMPIRIAGLVCDSAKTLSNLPCIAEKMLGQNDVVIVASQFAAQIIDRLEQTNVGHVFNATEILARLIRQTQELLKFELMTEYRAPFEIAMYRDILKTIAKHSDFFDYSITTLSTTNSRAFHRFDIDTQACCQQFTTLLDIAIEEGVIPAVYIRTDQLDYDPNTIAADVNRYRALGVEFGLHTSCYANPEPHQALDNELTLFKSTFGFQPPSLTVHGLGEQFKTQRLEMGEYIADNLAALGLIYADIPNRFRQYHHVIQDCHLHPEQPLRVLKNDVHKIQRIADTPIDYLLLIHPCYWQ